MNKRQVRGTAKDAVGRVQREVGRVTRNRTQQAKGIGKQIAGKAERTVGDVQEEARKSERARTRRPRAI
jgi:uncharacterized protein YjbJ (UPF0337 family)